MVDHALIAGAKPAVDKGGGIGGGVVDVARADAGSPHADLARRSGGKHPAAIVQDCHFGPGGDPHRAGAPRTRRQGIARHLMGGLGHAVGFDHRASEQLFQLPHHRGRQGGGRGAQKPQPMAADRGPVAFAARQDRLIHGRHRRDPCRLRLLEPAEEFQGVESGRGEDAGAGGQRTGDGADQPVDMEQRHDVEAAILGAEGQSRPDLGGRGSEIGLGQRHQLGTRGGARGMQHQGGIAGRGGPAGSHRARGPAEREAETPRRRARLHLERGDGNSQPFGDGTRRRFGPRGDQQRLGLQIAEIELELGGAIGGIEGRGGAGGTAGDEGSRRLGPVGQDHGQAVAPPDAFAVERGDGLADLPVEFAMEQCAPPGRRNRHIRRARPGEEIDERGHGLRSIIIAASRNLRPLTLTSPPRSLGRGDFLDSPSPALGRERVGVRVGERNISGLGQKRGEVKAMGRRPLLERAGRRFVRAYPSFFWRVSASSWR